MEIAIAPGMRGSAGIVGIIFFLIALIFVWRSFFAMRIPLDE